MTEEITVETAAHWRAMPATRLLDGGMDYADIVLLERATRDGVAWDVAAERLGNLRLEVAEAARKGGHTVTARNAFRAAAADFVFAQMAINADTERKRDLYEGGFSAAVGAAAALSPASMHKIELPFAGGRLVGWHVIPDRSTVLGTVIVFGGQSGWGGAPTFATRTPLQHEVWRRSWPRDPDKVKPDCATGSTSTSMLPPRMANSSATPQNPGGLRWGGSGGVTVSVVCSPP